MADFDVKPLTTDTWDAYAALIEKHNGVWGGCWCTNFHRGGLSTEFGVAPGRDCKEKLVEVGIAHAAVVFDGDAAIGWCQYGTPDELPSVYYQKDLYVDGYRPPAFRITCFFVDRDYRRRGVGARALAGALQLIGEAGGGVVESYPQDTEDKRTSASFLFNGTVAMFEAAGFKTERPVGKRHFVVRKTVRKRAAKA